MQDERPAHHDLGTFADFSSRPVAPLRHRRIAVIGFGRTAEDAPVADQSWEFWGMNGFHRVAALPVEQGGFALDAPDTRWSLWLDMHTLDYTRRYGAAAKIGDAQERWLEQPHPFAVLSIEARPEWPSVEAYPIDAVIARGGRDYFTSSVAYALALALTQLDVAEVGCWGIDLAHDSEYADQRPCAEYWIGRLEAAGIKVTIHERSALLRQRSRYGYELDNPLLVELLTGLRAHEKLQAEAVRAAVAKMEELRLQAATDDGALQQTRATIARLEIWQRGGRADA